MKKFSTMLLIALGALATVSCNKEIEDVNNGTEETVKSTISFKAVADAPTKATLTDDYDANNVFVGGWEEHDAITVDYGNNDLVSALWDAETECFRNVFLKAQNDIYAYYPDTKDGYYSFSGSNRKQEGNKYDSYFDLMYSDKFSLHEGKNDVVVPMHRATAIQYFHLTADESAEWANLKVQSATLSVTGEKACISSSTVLLGNDGTIVPDDVQNSITISFYDGDEPTAKDVQLWFNVLPCHVESMTITVELEDGYTWTKTNDFSGKGYTFEAGQLGYVKGAPVYKKYPAYEKYTFQSFTQTNDVTFDPDYFTISFHKNAGSTAPQWNANSNEARVYAKGSVVVSSDKTIKKVVYNYTINANSSNVVPTVDGAVGSKDAGAWDATNKVWTGSDNVVTLSTSGTAGNLGFKNIIVFFEDVELPEEYSVIIANSIQNGSVSANPYSDVKPGTVVTLTAVPDEGYEFSAWTVTNASTSDNITVTDNKFTMPAADVNVSAKFVFDGTITTMSAADDADIKFVTGSSSTSGALWTKSTPLSANNITLSGSVTSGTNYSYYDGSVVRFYTNNTIVITPSNGATIKMIEIVRQSTTGSNSGTINCSGLTASSENTTTNTNVYTGAATSDVTFTNTAQARFTKIIVYSTGGGVPPTIYTTTVADNIANGTVTATPTSAAEGTTVTLTATPENGYEFESWNVTGATVADATSATTTFTMPAANVNVSATFIPVQGGGEGSVWTRCTSVADITSGGTFIIGYEATAKSGKIIPMKNNGGTATTSAAGYMASGSEIDMATVTATSDYEFTIVASTSVDGAVCIKCGDDYIGNTDTKNNLKLFTEEATTTAFGVTVDTNDVFTFKIAANDSYHTLQYNTSSPRFAVYGGAQKNLVVYKKK